MVANHRQLSLPIIKGSQRSVVYLGDASEVLRRLPSEVCQVAVTSPPYWGLRDYENPDQIGSEDKVDDYINKLAGIFRELKRVLNNSGTFWLNIGDSYTSGGRTWRGPDKKSPARAMSYRAPTPEGLKPKELVGVPWRLAMALQADGWYLRSDIIWYKPNPLPESVKDRPTRAHEYIFLFTKDENYYYDYQAIQEIGVNKKPRNKHSVWNVKTRPFNGLHFATFPPELIKPCILAGSRPGDFVIDPFFGSGTTGLVAGSYDRSFIGVEINKHYIDIAAQRLSERSIYFDVINAK